MNLIVGMDDIATGTQKCEGWTLFILPERYQPEFENDARDILKKTTLSAFHGREYDRRFYNEYEEFLQLIKTYSLKTPQARAVNCLLSRQLKRSLEANFKRMTENSLKIAGVNQIDIVEGIKQYVDPLYSLLRESEGLAQNLGMEVYLDHDSKLIDLTKIQLKRKNKLDVPAINILKDLANAYQKKLFPKSPMFVNKADSTPKCN